MYGKLGAISILLIILVSSLTLPASAQTPILDPEITLDCQRLGNSGPIHWPGGGWIHCVITNDDFRTVRIEVTWSASDSFRKVSGIDIGANDSNVSNGQELELESNDEFEIVFRLYVKKMEPGEAPFEVQIVATETEEINGWRDCQNCEVHESEIEFETGPWGIINRGKILSSNILGFPPGLTFQRGDTNDLICNEELLTNQSLSFSLELESSNAGRDSMFGKFIFTFTLTSPDNPNNAIYEEAKIEFDVSGEAISNVTLNLNVPSNRSGDWYVNLNLRTYAYMGSYWEGLGADTLIDRECLLDPSMVDPDTINPTKNDPEDLSAISMLSTFIVIGVAAIYVSDQRESLIQLK